MAEEELTAFIAYLRRRRQAQGILQRQIAEIVGVVPEAVAKWERGAARPVTEHLRAWAAALAVRVPGTVHGGREHYSAACGTRSGYIGHRRRGEATCEACRAAANEYNRQRRER